MKAPYFSQFTGASGGIAIPGPYLEPPDRDPYRETEMASLSPKGEVLDLPLIPLAESRL